MALPLLIAGLVVLDQAIWTYRCQLIVRGKRTLGSLLGVVNAVVYVTAVAQVVANLDQPANIVGYAAGVGVGTYLGSFTESRLGSGYAEVRLFTATGGHALVEALRALGWPATATEVGGISGRATQVVVIVDRSRVPTLTEHVASLDPDAFVSVAHLADAVPTPLPHGFRQIGHRPRRARVPVRRGRLEPNTDNAARCDIKPGETYA